MDSSAAASRHEAARPDSATTHREDTSRDDSRVVYTSGTGDASHGLEALAGTGTGAGATGYTRWLERKQSLEERPTDWRRVLLQ